MLVSFWVVCETTPRALRLCWLECGDNPFEDRAPRPGRDGQQAEAVGLTPQPLAVVPAGLRPPRLLLAFARPVVAQDLLLVFLVEEDGAHSPIGRDAVVGGPDGERGEQEVTIKHDRGAAGEVVAYYELHRARQHFSDAERVRQH